MRGGFSVKYAEVFWHPGEKEGETPFLLRNLKHRAGHQVKPGRGDFIQGYPKRVNPC